MNIEEMTEDQRKGYERAIDESKRAYALLAEYDSLMDRMRNEFPADLFCATKAQLRKAHLPNSVLGRVKYAAGSAQRSMARFDLLRQALAAEARKREEDERNRQREAEAQQLTADAILWIQAKYPERRLGVDFGVADAVDYANALAFDDEVAKITAECQLHEFIGQNCSDYLDEDQHCGGWDGKSKRCQCGNRRVSWQEGCGHSFKSPCVVAEAY